MSLTPPVKYLVSLSLSHAISWFSDDEPVENLISKITNVIDVTEPTKVKVVSGKISIEKRRAGKGKKQVSRFIMTPVKRAFII